MLNINCAYYEVTTSIIVLVAPTFYMQLEGCVQQAISVRLSASISPSLLTQRKTVFVFEREELRSCMKIVLLVVRDHFEFALPRE